jgi:general secretion pathway protein H
MTEKHRNSAAFTLIELIIVLVIITIGAVISVPRITTGIDSAKFRGAISEVVTFLRDAHLEAVLERKNISVSLDYEENTLIRDDEQLFNIPPDIILSPVKTDDYEIEKYTFYNNGRGTGPRMEFVDSSERKATVYVDLISGLAKCDLK